MGLLSILFIIAAIDLSIAGPFASAQDCIENWCQINPKEYKHIEVSKDQPGRITCTIPDPQGLDIRIVNHFGVEVRRDVVLSQYVVPVSININRNENKSYELEIRWPQESDIQGRLRVVQCIGLFYGSRHPCRTSLVNIKFAGEIDATTTSAETTTTTEVEKEGEKITSTATSSDVTTTKLYNNQHTETKKFIAQP